MNGERETVRKINQKIKAGGWGKTKRQSSSSTDECVEKPGFHYPETQEGATPPLGGSGRGQRCGGSEGREAEMALHAFVILMGHYGR